jgi:hypothetical protein
METMLTKFVGYFLSSLKWIALSIFGRVMGGAGLAFANFKYALPQVKSWLMEQAAGLPPEAVHFLGACGVDVFMVLIISAVVARVGIKAVLTTVTSLEGMIAQEQGA